MARLTPSIKLYAEPCPAQSRSSRAKAPAAATGPNRAIARQFPWAHYKTFADVGTAQGDLAVQIAAHNTHLQGIGFDLPEVAPIFEQYAEENGVSGQLRFQPGDFFNDALPAVDVRHDGP
jgi:methylase of polypeptide subunit release factors